MGDPLEVFAESTADDEGYYLTTRTQFGVVVSKDVATDSLILWFVIRLLWHEWTF